MKTFLTLLVAALPAFSHTLTFDGGLPRLYQVTTVNVDGNNRTLNVGQIGIWIDTVYDIMAYCAAPGISLLTGPTDVTPVPDTLFAEGQRLAWIYNFYNPAVTQGWEAAAVQVAIWEVVLDSDDNLTTGRFRYTADSQIQTRAIAILAASAGQSDTGVVFWVPDAGPTYSQTLLSADPTPEPPALVLGAAALLLLFPKFPDPKRVLPEDQPAVGV
ncbi:MAG: hypothetical protein FJW32_07105 [Acidobacteria bacterium]|nr:hypothetical protein [Acidobacteriota bacterium]